jgi:hypothetical protein
MIGYFTVFYSKNGKALGVAFKTPDAVCVTRGDWTSLGVEEVAGRLEVIDSVAQGSNA